MAQQRMLGTELYLFTDGTGVPAPHLIVSSHGAYVSRPEIGKEQEGGGWLRVPAGLTLFFYGPHKKPLQDPTVEALLSLDPLESKGAGELVRNYRLSKFQNGHGSESETYANLLKGIDANRSLATVQETMLAGLGMDLSVAASTDQRRRAYEALVATLSPADRTKLTLAFGQRRIERYDVLTIRNRSIDLRSALGLGVTLRRVLAAIPAAYERIHCSFCRVSVFAPFTKGHTASAGTDWDRRPNGARRP